MLISEKLRSWYANIFPSSDHQTGCCFWIIKNPFIYIMTRVTVSSKEVRGCSKHPYCHCYYHWLYQIDLSLAPFDHSRSSSIIVKSSALNSLGHSLTRILQWQEFHNNKNNFNQPEFPSQLLRDKSCDRQLQSRSGVSPVAILTVILLIISVWEMRWNKMIDLRGIYGADIQIAGSLKCAICKGTGTNSSNFFAF